MVVVIVPPHFLSYIAQAFLSCRQASYQQEQLSPQLVVVVYGGGVVVVVVVNGGGVVVVVVVNGGGVVVVVVVNGGGVVVGVVVTGGQTYTHVLE